MELLIPIVTAVLVILGGVCMFISIENDKRLRRGLSRNPKVDIQGQHVQANTMYESSYRVSVPYTISRR